MPMKSENYPNDWKQISLRIRERDGNKCQQCGVQNGHYIYRSEDLTCWYDCVEDAYFAYPSGERLPERFEADMREKGVLIVLTVAHIDQDSKNNTDSNLRSLCQLCHLRYDAQQHAQNAKATRMAKKAAGSLFEAEEEIITC